MIVRAQQGRIGCYSKADIQPPRSTGARRICDGLVNQRSIDERLAPKETDRHRPRDVSGRK